MIYDKKIVAIIPARGGSKGVPLKNIKLLGGKPLITWTICEASKSNYIDKIIVTTDSLEIAEICENVGAEVPFIRPKKLALDDTPSSDVILHSLDWLAKNEKIEYDLFILLQPTSPFRKSEQIDNALDLFILNHTKDCLISVREVDENPYWMKIIDDKYFLKNFIKQNNNHTRRQDLPKIYITNGAIYIMNISDFLLHGSFNTDKTMPFIMDQESSIDIDTEIDFKLAELIIKEKKKNGMQLL